MKSILYKGKKNNGLKSDDEQIPKQRTQALVVRQESLRVEITQKKQDQARGQSKKRGDENKRCTGNPVETGWVTKGDLAPIDASKKEKSEDTKQTEARKGKSAFRRDKQKQKDGEQRLKSRGKEIPRP